ITWALGFATALIGHLNIFSLAVVTILLGLGIDFAIAFLSRYLQLRRENWPLRGALMETTATIGAPTMTAAATAALAFLCTLLTDFVGVAELGIVAAAGIVLCVIGAFFVLPALVALADEKVSPARLPRPLEGNWLRKGIARWPLATLIASAILIVAAGLQVVR